MKRIYSFLFAILTLAATTGVFTSCQEDAPEIDYTINITVNNDFTEVIDAINNGTMKQEAAITALTAAINGMTGSDPVKLDALIEAINNLASTIDAKLAILEAAMKAQTLALETKLALLETAIKNIPDYSDNLAALTASIDAIKAAVAAGNLSQEEALAEILALLEGIDAAANPDYVTFTADAEQTLSYEGSDLQYSTDGITFNHLSANTPVTFGGPTILYLRGVDNLDGNFYESGGFKYGYKISFGEDDVPVACTGDIRTLIDYKTYKTVDTSNATFRSLFEDCTELTSAPALPATTLAANCYEYMFYKCTSLTEAPELPATTLAPYCYNGMFSKCTSLVNAPALPATTLADYCYRTMFWWCTSLTDAPALPATTLADYCYYGMFFYCTSLEDAPALPATTLAEGCYKSMFAKCASLVNAPALPATTLAAICYQSMFNGCSSLKEAPALPATTLADNCYNHMFFDCTSLNKITMLATDISATDCLNNWVSGVAATGTFTKAASATIPNGAHGIPSGWTVVNQ